MIRNMSLTCLSLILRQYRGTAQKFFSTTTSLPNTWKLGKLNHVAIAVADLKKSTKMYRDVLGAKVSEPEPQHNHGVYTVFVELGDTKIELLYPLGDKSPIESFLKKNPAGGIHHICLNVSDVRKAMKTAKENGIRVLDNEPKIGAHGKPVVFLHPKDCGGVLTELEEE
ncbi:ethylmalonyl-CoA/methylmalonyl-CoA epimerase-like [Hydractinia symbiolongicarpus]|uniref:ethylmalonyl-CoA/methylmalonyl-CoA epimerase-like n=1 Tax=Hydractinia symbiolongicarpus TaxID=13093 RepID=UPI00254BC0B7|nr:ethylmalonyl-CoA/methylmalonyl-CoA epimerase-like [Hydractinia symbiolongicarpus]